MELMISQASERCDVIYMTVYFPPLRTLFEVLYPSQLL